MEIRCVELQCGARNGVDPRQRAFVDEGFGDRFSLHWEPQTVEFVDGHKLEAKP